jgi:hypothetical protein
MHRVLDRVLEKYPQEFYLQFDHLKPTQTATWEVKNISGLIVKLTLRVTLAAQRRRLP